MSIIEFDRDAAGVVANRDWTDSQTFTNIAVGVGELVWKPNRVFVELPEDTVGGAGKTDNGGRIELKNEAKYALETIHLIVQESSDACGLLGSGVSETSMNFDASEAQATADFDFLTSEVAS